jgi:Flp pilus assembly protein TadG
VPKPVRDDRGLTESVQLAILWPLLMLATLGIIQSGIWLHARNVAFRAATVAVDAARGSYGSAADAEAAARGVAESGGLKQVQVSVIRRAAIVDVTVRARAVLILDLGLGSLTANASAPVERVSQP